jgi:hypothetical protein
MYSTSFENGEIVHAVKILLTWDLQLYFHTTEGVLRIFIDLKNRSP